MGRANICGAMVLASAVRLTGNTRLLHDGQNEEYWTYDYTNNYSTSKGCVTICVRLARAAREPLALRSGFARKTLTPEQVGFEEESSEE